MTNAIDEGVPPNDTLEAAARAALDALRESTPSDTAYWIAVERLERLLEAKVA